MNTSTTYWKKRQKKTNHVSTPPKVKPSNVHCGSCFIRFGTHEEIGITEDGEKVHESCAKDKELKITEMTTVFALSPST